MPDLSKLIQAIGNIRQEQSPIKLNELLNEINSLFTNANCVDVLFTKNTDYMPFGIMVTPSFSQDNINSILISGSSVKVNRYFVEIDSKTFTYGLDDEETAAILIYNIYHLTNDFSPVDRLRNAIDSYFASTGTQLNIRTSIQYQKILEFGLIDTLVKFTNCLYTDSDILNDAYLVELGLEDSFTTGIAKLFNKYPEYTNDASRHPMLVILDWCFRLYNDVEHERIPAIKQLERSRELNPSVLYKKMIKKAIDALGLIDNDSMLTESYNMMVMNEGKKQSLYSQIKYNGLRGIEDDFYEFMVRARNAETEEEVMYALKQINVRLSILDDYIRNENLSDEEKKRWTTLYIKYCDIRDEIANKKVYNKKNYGIFFDYNQLDKIYNDED